MYYNFHITFFHMILGHIQIFTPLYAAKVNLPTTKFNIFMSVLESLD
jgi:hypothetical protein